MSKKHSLVGDVLVTAMIVSGCLWFVILGLRFHHEKDYRNGVTCWTTNSKGQCCDDSGLNCTDRQ
jgi:hypothetical protein